MFVHRNRKTEKPKNRKTEAEPKKYLEQYRTCNFFDRHTVVRHFRLDTLHSLSQFTLSLSLFLTHTHTHTLSLSHILSLSLSLHLTETVERLKILRLHHSSFFFFRIEFSISEDAPFRETTGRAENRNRCRRRSAIFNRASNYSSRS